MAVDFDAVRENAAVQGIALAEIAIIYNDLTPDELAALQTSGLVTNITEKAVIGRFTTDGRGLFANKAIGVYCLAAS